MDIWRVRLGREYRRGATVLPRTVSLSRSEFTTRIKVVAPCTVDPVTVAIILRRLFQDMSYIKAKSYLVRQKSCW
jgi:hypothetical protein